MNIGPSPAAWWHRRTLHARLSLLVGGAVAVAVFAVAAELSAIPLILAVRRRTAPDRPRAASPGGAG